MFNRLKPHILPGLLLLAATGAVYFQSLGHDFIADWDDNKYVTANEAVRGFTLEHLKAAFGRYYVGNYAPLHIISYMLDYSLWGMRAAGFIFTNILLHALNGLLYYALLIRITGRRTWAFLASFVFLLHPVQVESVAWISQRKNVLAMFFFLISFLLYVGYRNCGLSTGHQQKAAQNSKLMYTSSIAAFILALLAKSAAVVLPPVLVLYELCHDDKNRRGKRLVAVLPYIAVTALIALIALRSHASESGGGITGYHGGTPLATFFTMLPVLVRYLGMIFWPAELSAAYNPPVKTGIDGTVALSALILTALFFGGFFLYRRRKDLFFWGAVFFIGFLPVSQIVPLVTLMNDRYLYFPMLGGAAFVAGFALSGMDALWGAPRKAAVVALCLVLLSLPLLTWKRAEVWQNSLTLWTDAYSKDPDNPLVCYFLGIALTNAGNIDSAIVAYQRALSLAPLDRDILQGLIRLYLERGELSRAYPLLLHLVNNHPKFADAFLALGHYYFLTGDMQGAENALNKALQLDPRSAFALKFLGHVYLEQNKTDAARHYYYQSLAAGGESAELRYNLASLEAAAGRSDAALKHLEEAIRLGYRDIDSILKDRKLDNIKSHPDFRRLLEKYFAQAQDAGS